MSMWTAIVVIVAIACFTAIKVERYRALGRGALPKFGPNGTDTARLDAAREAELEREVVDLKKRLAVLERIATDDRQSRAIANEIESLRER
jgi:hypothetical protein